MTWTNISAVWYIKRKKKDKRMAAKKAPSTFFVLLLVICTFLLSGPAQMYSTYNTLIVIGGAVAACYIQLMCFFSACVAAAYTLEGLLSGKAESCTQPSGKGRRKGHTHHHGRTQAS